jgi:two-component system phosphate regulon response regulator PhoB
MVHSISSTQDPANERNHILVVEDETEIRDLIALHLKREGHLVDAAGSAEEAMPLLDKNKYSLVALDWMLPGTSGIDVTRRLRERSDRNDLAILMVTARADAGDIVEGLEAGADDYLSKPFEPQVLIARVRALLRRNRRPKARETEGDLQVVKIGNLSLYPETFESKCCGEPLSLTASEFKLLLALAANRGRVLTRDSLIQQVQGEGVSVVGRTVDTHVFGLRKKLGDCSEVIETVRGVGYRVKAQSELA